MLQRTRKVPEPICDHERGKLVCARCQQKIDRMTAEMVSRSEIGRQMTRRLTLYGNLPARS